jgi:hypothetical protein
MNNGVSEGNFGRPWYVTILGRNRAGARPKRKIAQEMKAWMDNVFIPAMVRQYLANPVLAGDNGSSTTERVQ